VRYIKWSVLLRHATRLSVEISTGVQPGKAWPPSDLPDCELRASPPPLQVERHAELMGNVVALKSHQQVVEGRLQRREVERNEARVHAQVAQEMQSMQSTEVVLLRHKCDYL
jgi:hypothetical protein